jgi:hypothetical protein
MTSDMESLASLVVRRMKALWEGMRVLRSTWARAMVAFVVLDSDLLKESRAAVRSESQRNGDRRRTVTSKENEEAKGKVAANVVAESDRGGRDRSGGGNGGSTADGRDEG